MRSRDVIAPQGGPVRFPVMLGMLLSRRLPNKSKKPITSILGIVPKSWRIDPLACTVNVFCNTYIGVHVPATHVSDAQVILKPETS